MCWIKFSIDFQEQNTSHDYKVAFDDQEFVTQLPLLQIKMIEIVHESENSN